LHPRGACHGPHPKEVVMFSVFRVARLPAALAVAAAISACTVFEGRQDVAGYTNDSVITNTIRAKYVEDPVVNFGDVAVTTMNGNVRLSGRVDSASESARAGQIARSVDGVRSVDNEILVRRR
jgi:hyperosmotically inducible protein